DYFAGDPYEVDRGLQSLSELETDELLDLHSAARVLELPLPADLDLALQPRGYRLLSRVPRLPEPVIARIVDRFGNLHKILRATLNDLDDAEGVGSTRARAIKDGLSRLAASSILDRYA